MKRLPMLLAATGVVLTGGAYMGMSLKNQASVQSPKSVADAFITAIIRSDVNEMGRLVGIDPAQGSPMDQTFGKVLGPELEKYWRGQAQQLTDYHWETNEQQSTGQSVRLQVDLNRPDYGAIAHKTDELLGFSTNNAGLLVAP